MFALFSKRTFNLHSYILNYALIHFVNLYFNNQVHIMDLLLLLSFTTSCSFKTNKYFTQNNLQVELGGHINAIYNGYTLHGYDRLIHYVYNCYFTFITVDYKRYE